MNQTKTSLPAITPVGNRVLLRKQEKQATTSGGIILPDSAQEKPNKAVVVGAGQTCKETWTKGDVVLYKQYAVQEFEHNGTSYIVAQEEDIMVKFNTN